MRAITTKLKPKSGFSSIFHLLLNLLLPVLLFVLVRIQFVQLAAIVVLLSKWRMLAVRPRYWPANIRANAVDIIVGLSIVIFMAASYTFATQLFWAFAYAVWLILIKPGSTVGKTSLQALTAQLAGLMALFISFGGASAIVLVIGVWLVCYSSARHFFTSFEETHTSLYAHTWGYFAAALAWVLSHWLLFYGSVAQPTLLLTVIGFGLAALYYLDQTDRLSKLVRRQFVFIMVAIVVVILTFSDWGDKAV